MNHAKTWYEGSITIFLFRDINLSSQRINDFLERVGNERLLRNFIGDYISTFTKQKEGVIIDTTSLPNQIIRYLPGSIVDVSTLNTTMEECKKQR